MVVVQEWRRRTLWLEIAQGMANLSFEPGATGKSKTP
jgi:hypothetical protein